MFLAETAAIIAGSCQGIAFQGLICLFFLATAYVSSLVTVSQERSWMNHGLEMWGMAMQRLMVPANCNKEKMTVCMA